jgi:hypothetical protein
MLVPNVLNGLPWQGEVCLLGNLPGEWKVVAVNSVVAKAFLPIEENIYT